MSRFFRVMGAFVAVVTALVLSPPGKVLPRADAASVVATSHCRSFDPNLVHGACLRYKSGSGYAYTWIGSFRAANGRVFFCIDYLYDSRIAGRPTLVSTKNLVNQLGRRVGDAEVAALNYIVSTWAAHGSTGHDSRDAAIALIIRELMSDGARPDGMVVYPKGLKVGGRVKQPIGGLGGPIMKQAQQMWTEASAYRGGYRIRLTTAETGPLLLGASRRYLVEVLSAAGRRVPGVKVSLTCTGPITCPAAITSGAAAVPVVVKPRALGRSTLRATASGPAADGTLYRVGSWRTHGGSTARDNGVQRGWIAQRSATTAAVSTAAVIVKGTPVVITKASSPTAGPGAALTDQVVVSALPAGYKQTVTATLYGPFVDKPRADSCKPDVVAGKVSFVVDRNGEFRTPPVTVNEPGYYVWTESLPGDARTNPVTTACGIAEETTLVQVRTPQVRTEVSAQEARVGAELHDTVVVAGLETGDLVTVDWTLHGPVAPRDESCQGLDWAGAPVADQGSFEVDGSGTRKTEPTTITEAGCYTYSEQVPATLRTGATSTEPGVVAETSLVTSTPEVPEVRVTPTPRNPLPPKAPKTPVVPEIPSGPSRLPVFWWPW